MQLKDKVTLSAAGLASGNTECSKVKGALDIGTERTATVTKVHDDDTYSVFWTFNGKKDPDRKVLMAPPLFHLTTVHARSELKYA